MQFTFGLILPAGLLLGNCFDLDRDTPQVRDEVAAVLAQVFGPQEYKMVDYVMEGRFKDGKVLLRIHL